MPYDYIEEYQKQDDETIWEFRDKDAQSKIDISLTETDYANPLSLETMQAQHAKNTKVKIEPIQDLHGFDKPWVGGAGKNLLPLTVDIIKTLNTSGTWTGNSYAINGVTYTILTDLDNNVIGIDANNTASNNADIVIYRNESGISNFVNMIINGCNNGSSSTYGIAFESKGIRQVSGDFTITSEYRNSKSIYIRVAQGIQVTNAKFYPMIRLSTETDATFQPYTNIASITGHDQIDILGCGENLFGFGITTEDKTIEYRATSSQRLKLEQINSEYNAIKCTFSGGSYARGYLVIKGLDGTQNYNISAIVKNNTTSYTPIIIKDLENSNSGQLSLQIGGGNGSTAVSSANSFELHNIYVYANITKTDYEPFILSNNLTIDLPSTVYGGVLDLESGVLSLVNAMNIYNGSEDEVWSKYGLYSASEYAMQISETSIKNHATMISNYLQSVPEEATWGNFDSFVSMTSHSQPSGRKIITGIKAITTVEAWKTYLASNPLQVCYELATPTTIQLTPHQLSLLKAQNNLTTSQYTQIKVTYRNGVFATLEELSDTANGIYDEISGDAITVSGNPINFTTREKQKSKSTIIDLEPIQDLHGYSKPWIGGAGKNLLPMTVEGIKAVNTSGGTWSGNTFTHNNGVTFTILTDTDNNVIGIKVNGISSGQSQFYIKLTIGLSSGTYILNGAISSSKRMYFYDGTSWHDDNGSGTTFTITSQTTQTVAIAITNGTTVSNEVYYPMIRKSTVTDATFEPYTNIASISGRSSVDINGCGKNLFDKDDLEDGGIDSSTGEDIYVASLQRTNGYISVKPNTSYYFSGSSTQVVAPRIFEYDKYGNFIQSYLVNLKSSMTTTANTARLRLHSSNFDTFKNSLQIEEGSSASLYEPYTPSTDLTISFGTTVYGGRLDVEKGMLTITDGKKKVSDFTWSNADSAGIKRFKTSVSDIFVTGVTRTLSEVYCKQYETISDGRNFSECPLYCIYTDNVSGLFIQDQRYTDANNFSTNEADTEVVYKLATPQTIQLTPQQVQLLKGINNISTTGTTITVTFKNGSVAHLDDLPDFTDYDKEKLASIDTLAITLDLLNHMLIVTQDI